MLQPEKQKTPLAAGEEIQERLYAAIVKKMLEKKISRRKFLMASAVMGTAGVAAVDKLILHGRGRDYLHKLLNDQEFQKKLLQSLESGEFFAEDLPQLLEQDRVTASIELGERVNTEEPWMQEIFENFEVRQLINSGEYTGRHIFIADLDSVDILQAQTYGESTLNGSETADVAATMNRNHPFAVLPHSQMRDTYHYATDSDFEYHQLTPLKYAQYQTPDGTIITYDEEGKNYRGGALVLNGSQLEVVDVADLHNYEVGKNNCRALRVVNYTIRSEQKEEDLAQISGTDTLSLMDANSPSYPSFVVTFSAADGTKKSKLISIYTHFDPNSSTPSQEEWPKTRQLDLKHMTELCDQIQMEEGFTRYDLAVTDDDEYGAVMVSEVRSSEEVKAWNDRGIINLPTDPSVRQSSTLDLENGQPWGRTLWVTPFTQFSLPLISLVAKKS